MGLLKKGPEKLYVKAGPHRLITINDQLGINRAVSFLQSLKPKV